MYHATPSDKPEKAQLSNRQPGVAQDCNEPDPGRSDNIRVFDPALSDTAGVSADDVPPRGMGRSRGSRPRKIRPPSASAARSSSNEEPMIDDNRAYRKDYRLECELYDEDADEEPDPYEDEPNLLQIGNIKPRDLDGDHCFITREVAEGEAESRNTGDVGQALSNIDGFSADDVPQWDGEE